VWKSEVVHRFCAREEEEAGICKKGSGRGRRAGERKIKGGKERGKRKGERRNVLVR